MGKVYMGGGAGGGSTTAWLKEGNAGTDPAINFIGTTDAQDLVFRRNSLLVARFARNAPGAQNRFYVGGNTTTDVPFEVRWDDATTYGLILRSKDTNKIIVAGDVMELTCKNIVLNAISTYADDAAADADSDLQSGALYKITGDRAVYQKP